MISFKIQGTSYKIAASLKEITLKRYLEYLEWRDTNLPQFLQDMEAMTQEERLEYEISKGDGVKWLEFQHKEIAFWFNEDVSLIKRCQLNDVLFVWGLIQKGLTCEEDPTFCCLEVNGVQYFLPNRLMTESTFEDYTEACQYEETLSKVLHGEYKALPYITAILARKQGERLEDYDVQSRADIFEKKLTAWDLVQVGFFLQRQSAKSSDVFQIYTTASMLTQLKQGTKR